MFSRAVSSYETPLTIARRYKMEFTLRSRKMILLSCLAIGVCFTTARAQDAQSEAPRKTGALQSNALKRLEPTYPPLAKAARVDGLVVVEVTIDEEGNVVAARAVTGHPLLKEAAVTAARGWKFEPTTLDGTAAKVIGNITFNFSLDHSEEIGTLLKKLADDPSSAELHHQLGTVYLENAEPEKAIEHLTQAIILDRGFAKAYLVLGDAYSRTKMTELAIQTYREATRIKPDFAEAYYYLGMLYGREKRHQEAVDAFKQATTINDRMLLAYMGMGRSFSAMGRYHEAREPFQRATEIEPTSGDAYIALIQIYLKLGDKEAALKEYQTLKAIEPYWAGLLLDRINKEK